MIFKLQFLTLIKLKRRLKMKKLIFIIGFIFVALGLYAQGDIGLTGNSTYREYTGTAADTVQGTNAISKVVKIDKDYLYYYDVLVDLDTLSGGGGYGVSCVLSGSNDATNYTTITDVTFAASADTVFSYTNLAATATQTMGSYTSTQPTYTYYADSVASDSTEYVIPQIVTTIGAQTVTVPTEVGVMWRFLKLTLTGDNASTYAELQAIRVKVVKIP
jgi:hypothetical protein